jgi:hypothetical protein
MSSEEEEEVPPPLCGPLQVALLGSFKSAHREASTRVVHAITLEQMNAAIACLSGHGEFCVVESLLADG